MYYVIDKDKSRIQINLQASYRLLLCHEVLRREIYKDSFVPVLQSFVQRKVLMVFIFVKSTVFYARYFIVLHYHTVFYFLGFLFFVPYANKNIGGTYLLWALGGGEGGGIYG
jgi:hypothetical protein